MPSIERTLFPDEQIAFQTNKHLIIFLTPLIWTVFTVFLLQQRSHFVSGFSGLLFKNGIANLVWLPGIIAVFSWLNEGLNSLTSIFVVTNRRIIMREGFFFRHATETRLSAVA